MTWYSIHWPLDKLASRKLQLGFQVALDQESHKMQNEKQES